MIVLDRQKMSYLSPNTAAPFAMMRGYGGAKRGMDRYRGLGFDPATALALTQGAGSIMSKIEGFLGVGSGRREADQIVPIANDIHYQVFAPISAALEHPESLTYPDLQLMWDTITSTEDRWLAFLHTTQWSDGRAATQAERDFAPYFDKFKSEIQMLLGNITGQPPISQSVVNIPGLPRQSYLTSLPSASTVAQTAQSYLPWILAGAFIFMLPKIGKYK